MELIEQPVTLVLLGIIFLFGGLGVLKFLRRSSDSGAGRSGSEDEDA